MIQVDLIQMDDYPADSCAINPTAFLYCLDYQIRVCILSYFLNYRVWCVSSKVSSCTFGIIDCNVRSYLTVLDG